MTDPHNISALRDAAAAARTTHTGARIIAFDHDGATFWIKQSGTGKKLRILQKLLVMLTRNGKTADDTAHQLSHEAARLAAWRKAGLPVPDIVITADDFFVTRDTGTNLATALATAAPATRLSWIAQAARILQDAHQKKLCHGRPKIKDMTVNADERIYILDLEEDPAATLGFDKAAAQDIFIFLASATRYLDDDSMKKCAVDLIAAATPETRRHIRNTLRKLRPFVFMHRWCGRDRFGRDITEALRLLHVLHHLPPFMNNDEKIR